MPNWYRAYLDANPELKAYPEHKRAKHSIHFRRPDGKVEAHFTGAPAFYQDAQEAWQEIDTDLVDHGNYHAPTGVPLRWTAGEVSIDGGTYKQKPARVVRLRPDTQGVSTIATIPATGTVSGDTVTNSGTGWSYKVRFLADGVREELTLPTQPTFPGGTLDTDYICIETQCAGLDLPDGWVDAEYSFDGYQFHLPTAHDANGATPITRRYALKTGGVQYLYTGVTAAWLQAATYPVVVDPDFTSDTVDGTVTGQNAIYSTARSTAASFGDTSDYLYVGQAYSVAPLYTVFRPFLKFNTASIGSSGTISQVNLKLGTKTALAVNYGDIQIVKQNWSLQDPLSTGNMDTAFDNCLSGTADDSIWHSTQVDDETYYTSGNLATAYVDKTGFTYYSLRSSDDYDNVAPAGDEYLQLSSSVGTFPPILIVVYIHASGSVLYPSTAATSNATSPYDDEDWATPNNIKANDAAYATCGLTAATAGPTGVNNTAVTAAVAPYDDMDWDDKVGFNANDAATAGISGAAFDTNVISYLAKLQGLGFAIPAGSTITGVEVVIERTRTTNNSCVDACVQLLDASGNLMGDNKADTVNEWAKTTYVAVTYGGAGQMWGLTSAQLMAAVNDADFGVGFAVKATGDNVDFEVDYCTVKIYYNELLFDASDYSYLLKATNFGFNIGASETITGIKVSIERKAGAADSIKDAVVKLLDADGALTGDSKADTANFWPTSDTAKDYGGDGDLWGATLTPTTIMDADYGVAIAIQASTNDAAAYVDYITMTVYYGGTFQARAPAAIDSLFVY